MARIKYYYDTETCKYERIKTSTGDIILNTLGILSLTVAMAVGLLILYSSYFGSEFAKAVRKVFVSAVYGIYVPEHGYAFSKLMIQGYLR